MNKTVKGSLAGAAGIALLMGGYGSYALWSDSANLNTSSVTSGALTIVAGSGYYDDTRDSSGTPASPDWSAGSLMVPGDVITYTQTFTVTGTGKNLEGLISLAPSAMSPNGFSSNLTRSVDVTSSVADTVIHKIDATHFSFTDPFDSATLTATVTYTFASVANQGTTDQGKTATTPVSAFTISQS